MPLGDEFVVNSYTTSGQGARDVYPLADGGFVVVWSSNGSYGSDDYSTSVQARPFDSNGLPTGGQFQVNTYTTTNEQAGTVAATSAGDFLVTWRGPTPESDNVNIKGQWYDEEWSPLGEEFQINTYSAGHQHFPAVSSDGAGGLVVVWLSQDEPRGIRGQRYASDGSPAGGSFQVNSFTSTAPNSAPAVSPIGVDGFVVVWEQWMMAPPDDDRGSIQARRFTSGGTPLGPQFQVNTYTTLGQQHPAVSREGEEGFVVVWASFGSPGTDASSSSVQARRFTASGVPLGGQFQVNSFTPAQQRYPDVNQDEAGGFVVVWRSDYSESDPDGAVHGQRFGPDGLPAGDEFQLSSMTTGNTGSPRVTPYGEKAFVVVWTGIEVRARRFTVPLFADGFESGDTSEWSTTVPYAARSTAGQRGKRYHLFATTGSCAKRQAGEEPTHSVLPPAETPSVALLSRPNAEVPMSPAARPLPPPRSPPRCHGPSDARRISHAPEPVEPNRSHPYDAGGTLARGRSPLSPG